MPTEIKLPRLDWNMEHGTFLGWLKKPGDAVAAGDALFTLEGDKATQVIEALDGGVLNIPADAPKEGDRVPVGTVLGYLLAVGDTAPSLTPSSAPTPTAEASAPVPASPSVRRLAREMGVALDCVQGTGATGRITADDVKAFKQPASKELVSTPRARIAAAMLGVDWKAIKGTGRNGRVRERDIRGRTSVAATGSSKVRKVIAERMLHSLRTTAPVTLHTTADATQLLNVRSQFKAAGGAVPTITDLLVKLAARVLQRHPVINARWEDDRVVPSADVHIGIAVDTPAGLLVPVVRDVLRLSLKQVTAKAKELVEKARAGSLPGDAMRGGTFTVTNLGAFGIDAFTPIINWPECAILGVGRIQKIPVVADGQIVARDTVTLSLTFDHRIADGAPAARFLQDVVRELENPVPGLIESAE